MPLKNHPSTVYATAISPDYVVHQVLLPLLAADHVRVRVHAAGVNRADVLQADGLYPAPAGASPFLGLEIAGEIISTGAAVDGFYTGQRIAALCAGGGYADIVDVPASWCFELPATVSFTAGACLPEALLTYAAFAWREGEDMPKTILLQGGSGGIGHVGVGLFAALGARVVATARAAQASLVLAQGAADCLDFIKPGYLDGLAERFSLIIDHRGGFMAAQHLRCLAPYGTLVQLAALEGNASGIPVSRLVTKGLTWRGGALRRLSRSAVDNAANWARKVFLPLIVQGKVVPCVYKTMLLDQSREAHAVLRAGNFYGKVVLVA